MGNRVVCLAFDKEFKSVMLVGGLDMLCGIAGEALPAERKPRETATRLALGLLNAEIEPDEWTMFAEMLNPVAQSRTVCFFAAVESMPVNAPAGVFICPVSPEEIAGNLEFNLYWLIPLAVNWHRLGLRAVVAMENPPKKK